MVSASAPASSGGAGPQDAGRHRLLTHVSVRDARLGALPVPHLRGGLRIYEGLFGLAEFGHGFKWRAIAAAAAFATIGPTAWALVHKVPPRRSLAVAFALLFVIVLFKIGDDANYEFIYFQF